MSELPKPIPPADRKTFTINGAPVPIFMSFQRLNSLLRILETAERLPLITVDPDISEPCMRVLLSKDTAGQFAVDLDTYEIENATYDLMITWCQEHLIHFFTKRLGEMVSQNTSLEPVVKGLQSSLTGSAV